jgi:hypothetical protein
MTLRWPSNVKPYFYFYFVFKPFRPILRCITVAFLFFFFFFEPYSASFFAYTLMKAYQFTAIGEQQRHAVH